MNSAIREGRGKINFRTLTDKGLRTTQQKILEHIKLDYDTFINSAYLRQGRADEFMLKKPIERKQVFANLLKLDSYDTLSEQAKDTSKQFKAQVELLKQSLLTVQEQLQQKDALVSEQTQLQQATDLLSSQQQADTTELQQLQLQHHNRQTWQKLLTATSNSTTISLKNAAACSKYSAQPNSSKMSCKPS